MNSHWLIRRWFSSRVRTKGEEYWQVKPNQKFQAVILWTQPGPDQHWLRPVVVLSTPTGELENWRHRRERCVCKAPDQCQSQSFTRHVPGSRVSQMFLKNPNFLTLRLLLLMSKQLPSGCSAERTPVKSENEGGGAWAPPGVYLCTCLDSGVITVILT